jgi:hypothetical protein
MTNYVQPPAFNDPDPAKEAATSARFEFGRQVPVPLRPGKRGYECLSHGCYMTAQFNGYCSECNKQRAAQPDDSRK